MKYFLKGIVATAILYAILLLLRFLNFWILPNIGIGEIACSFVYFLFFHAIGSFIYWIRTHKEKNEQKPWIVL